jgi:predicted nuclease with RNAse H fold
MAKEIQYFIGWDVSGWLNKTNNFLSVFKTENGLIFIKSTNWSPYEEIKKNTSIEELLQKVLGIDDVTSENFIIAIDAPLSYPIGFTKLLNNELVKINFSQSIDNPLLYRETERRITEKLDLQNPLTAVADRIGHATTLAQYFVVKYLENQKKYIEIYPGVLKSNNISLAKNWIGEKISETGSELLISAWKYYAIGGTKSDFNTDALDSAIAALFAYMYIHGGINGVPKLVGPPTDDKNYDASEGWIYYPELDSKPYR